MLLFAMLLFGVMAMAALAIDLGMVRVTQRQMQSAVDAAALEGLRGWWPDSQNTQLIAQDQDRRQRASDMVTSTFTDATDAQLGAGPIVQFSGGIGNPDLAASQQLSVPDPHVYKPQMQTNLGDTPSGDMVAGQNVSGQSAAEANDYTRNDFKPYQQTNQPNRDAFLVRMRRTNEQVNDGMSVGPPMPLLFARGSLIQTARQNGIPVRATAIADGRQALYVYRSQDATQPTLVTFSLPVANWNGAVSSVDMSGAKAPDSPGAFVAVGQQTKPGSVSLPPANQIVYVPLFATVGNRELIVGFGAAQVSSDGTQLLKLKNYHALLYASASPAAIGPELDGLAASGTDISALFSKISTVDSPLLAPVLVR